MRVLGLDVGSARIGVALSDESRTIAGPLTTLDGKKDLNSTVRKILELCEEYTVTKIVIGMPLSLSGGRRGSSAIHAEKLRDQLAERGFSDVVFWDERFTTKEAEKALIGAGMTRANRRKKIDKVAASLILQGYLDSEKKSWEKD